MLPTLSFGSSSDKSGKNSVALKSAALMNADLEHYDEIKHQGQCYILDEDEPKLILEGVSYQVSTKSDLTVDIKLSPEEQERLNQLSKEFSGTRELVVLINNQVVSTPFLRPPIDRRSLPASKKNSYNLEHVLATLGS